VKKEAREELVKETLKKIDRSNVKYLKLLLIDIHGTPKGVIIPASRAESALSEGVGFDGSSIPGYVNIEKSDMVALPDPSTFLIPRWEASKTAVMLCNAHYPNGEPFEGDPRGLLERYTEKLRREGLTINVGAEPEYFYVKKGNSIALSDVGNYFDVTPLDLGEKIKRETVESFSEIGVLLDKAHHEVAYSQHEIDFKFSNALKTADNIIIFKLAVKAIAANYGLTATFMPKPFWGVNGNGCHVHQSVSDRNGENLFFDSESEIGLSEMAMHYMGGLLSHARGLSLIVAPLVNSYKRLIPGYEAPIYICWGIRNRSTLIRIPIYYPGKEKAMRIEYRHPDPSFNPYLAFTAMIAAGLDGVNRKLNPGKPYMKNAFHITRREMRKYGIKTLPENLGEAVKAFSEDKVIQAALGEHVSKRLIELKKAEWRMYLNATGKPWRETRTKITDWEIERYLERS